MTRLESLTSIRDRLKSATGAASWIELPSLSMRLAIIECLIAKETSHAD